MSYWQDRTEDYEAFVVVPTPLGTRAADAIRTACIHVALREEHLLDLLWNIGDEPDGRPNYANDYRMISWPDPSKTEEPRPKWPALASVLRTVSDSVRIEVQDLNPVTVPAA